MAARTEWTGTASELLGALVEMAGERITSLRPRRTARGARGLLLAATFLRKIGIDIGFEREGRARTRIIRITTGPSSSLFRRDRPHRPHRPLIIRSLFR
ncbi:MAG: hypothetical protein KF697_10625 [Pseudolabrys sp.]|nr:hypothetical protein [Pseudolabrys sp.]